MRVPGCPSGARQAAWFDLHELGVRGPVRTLEPAILRIGGWGWAFQVSSGERNGTIIDMTVVIGFEPAAAKHEARGRPRSAHRCRSSLAFCPGLQVACASAMLVTGDDVDVIARSDRQSLLVPRRFPSGLWASWPSPSAHGYVPGAVFALQMASPRTACGCTSAHARDVSRHHPIDDGHSKVPPFRNRETMPAA